MSENEKTHSKIQWFFLVICIPIIFAIILFSVILSFLGVDVMDKAREYSGNIPVVSSWMTEEEEEIQKIDVQSLEATIEEQQGEIERLQATIIHREEEIKSLKNEQAQVDHQPLIEEELYSEEATELKDIAKTYESMSTKNAAGIIAQLSTEDALLHLSLVSIEVRAGILSKMDSEVAADLMSRLASQ
jgi:flagellar motility protein MotE (MotC chaperone)